MSLHVLSGTLKGRSLKVPKTSLAKPTTSLLRKAVFDICQGYVEGARFLDLFACSGAMGIEAISRGASHATFIEKDKRATEIIKENLRSLLIIDKALVLCLDALTFLKNAPQTPFDLIYLDPPYDLPLCTTLLSLIDQNSFLAPQGLLFLEEKSPGSLDPATIELTSLRHKNTRRLSAAVLHQFEAV